MYAGNFGHFVSEYPEPSGAGEVVYDGYGNPVGFLPELIKKAVGMFRGGRGGPPGLPNLPGLPGFPGAGMTPFRRFPQPVGWVTPALPFTGRAPRRLYMRCAVWPGPAGLVPAAAMPGAPGMPGLPGQVPPGGFTRRRRFRRRRR